MIRGCLPLLAVAVLAPACTLWPHSPGPNAPTVVQSSLYCGSPVATADLVYFERPSAFAAWIDGRDLQGLEPGAGADDSLLLEMGRRPTTGYDLDLRAGASTIAGDTLVLRVDWIVPDPEDFVGQGLTSPCLVLSLPKGDYRRVQVVDQWGEQRAAIALP